MVNKNNRRLSYVISTNNRNAGDANNNNTGSSSINVSTPRKTFKKLKKKFSKTPSNNRPSLPPIVQPPETGGLLYFPLEENPESNKNTLAPCQPNPNYYAPEGYSNLNEIAGTSNLFNFCLPASQCIRYSDVYEQPPVISRTARPPNAPHPPPPLPSSVVSKPSHRSHNVKRRDTITAPPPANAPNRATKPPPLATRPPAPRKKTFPVRPSSVGPTKSRLAPPVGGSKNVRPFSAANAQVRLR